MAVHRAMTVSYTHLDVYKRQEGDSMDAIAGGKNNKAKQDNEAEPDIDEDSLIPDSPMFRMYLEELRCV